MNQQAAVGKDWFLVLSNIGDSVAADVACSLEFEGFGEASWTVLGRSDGEALTVESIGPHKEQSFNIIVGSRTSRKAHCTVQWSDSRGRQQRSAVLKLD